MSVYKKHINGTVSELLAESYFINNGYIVSKPINDFNEYDFVVDDEKGLRKVQVKTVYWDNNKNRNLVSCVTSHIRGNEHRYNKKYENGSYDILACVHKESGSVYIIPFDEVKGRRSITFYPEGKPDTVRKRYDDFENYKRSLFAD